MLQDQDQDQDPDWEHKTKTRCAGARPRPRLASSRLVVLAFGQHYPGVEEYGSLQFGGVRIKQREDVCVGIKWALVAMVLLLLLLLFCGVFIKINKRVPLTASTNL